MFAQSHRWSHGTARLRLKAVDGEARQICPPPPDSADLPFIAAGERAAEIAVTNP